MKKTALHQAHVDLGAKMGEFAGYDMPLFYGEGVMKEHEWVRAHCGIFDVSHMGQVVIEGEGVVAYLEKITPSAFEKKGIGRAQYTVLTNEQGGIIDDLIITRLDEHKFFAVINAGCKDKDIEWMKKHLPLDLNFRYMENHALIAVQGPWAERVVHEVLNIETQDMPYMHLMPAQNKYGTQIFVSRLGYTGEDGFEISVPNDQAAELWNEFNDHPEVKPIGLAARDSLRLEMGYALYGHDIDHETTPIEADLTWVMSKNNTDFIGAARVLKDREEGVTRQRVGIKLTDKGVAREGAEIRNADDQKIGTLTSGGFSPTLKESIGQGYVEAAYAETGKEIFVNVRGRNISAVVADLPFVPAKTKSMKKKAA